MSKNNLKQMIMELNRAYTLLNEAIFIIKKYSRINKNTEIYFWRIGKNFELFNKELFKYVKREDIDQQFKDITDKF